MKNSEISNYLFTYILVFIPLVIIFGTLPCLSEMADFAYPDIIWKPRPFVLAAGNSVRYIDFEKGDDKNSGDSKKAPWKHHPWDNNAKGNAADCRGIHTYCFKKGIIYRGSLVAKESGTPQNPIRLTVDPFWGDGKASIFGSIRIKEGWNRCTDKECPDIPSEGRRKTWYMGLDKSFVPRMLWEIHNNRAIRIPIARTPNWKITNIDDPRSQWWELTGHVLEMKVYLDKTIGFNVGDKITGKSRWEDIGENKDDMHKLKDRVTEVAKNYIKIDSWNWKKGELKTGAYITNGQIKAKVLNISGTHEVVSRLIDDKHLTQSDPKYWVGATMWSEKNSMPKPDAEKIIRYDPKEHSLRVNYHRGVNYGPQKYDRYYLENLLKFLDSPREYYYSERGKNAGRLFIRLPEERNPNASIIEAAKNYVIIDIHNKNNITISGLTLKFSNAIDCGTQEARFASLYNASVRIRGTSSNIKIKDLEISNVVAGIIAVPEKIEDVLNKIELSDNDFRDIDESAIGLSNGRSYYRLKDLKARLIYAKVLRNRLRNIGFRVLSHWGLGPHAIHIEGGERVEIADNIIDRCWGSGILAYNGDEYSRSNVAHPLIRILIHHNKVTNSLLGMQDYGGIESWMAGPCYIYDNISGNPVGYKHSDFKKLKKKNWYRTSCFGAGIYLDGQYKGYVFNNIIWGKNNNVNDRIYNSSAFNEAMGFMNVVFNNTMFNFGVGLHKGMIQHNRCYYLGNLMLDMGDNFIQQEPLPSTIEYHSLAYAKNVFKGTPTDFAQLGSKVYISLDQWKKDMGKRKVMGGQTGIVTEISQVKNANAHDFRLKSSSAAIDHGAKVFVPWSLYSVVGEWNFYLHPADPGLILGENMNWNSEWDSREMYQDIPRNDLKSQNIDADSYRLGILENWTKGAIKLNGKNQYCYIPDAFLKKKYKWAKQICENQPCHGTYNGKDRVSVDMGVNNFLVELVFQTEKGFKDGGIVCKRADTGYTFDIDPNGYIRLMLNFKISACSRTSSHKINDGKWHHVIGEVDRSKPEGINIYIDGMLSNGQWKGVMNSTETLSNTADFTVGKTLGSEEKYFKGLIDFLRISRGTFRDAETNIKELYSWEFDGPSLKDFVGVSKKGVCRDIGAVEYE